MSTIKQAQRREVAAAELAERCPQLQPTQLIDRLSAGLSRFRDLLVVRVHSDVKLEFGTDSMVAPLSSATGVKQVVRAGFEIDLYSSIVADDEVQRGGYVDRPGEWFLDWLVRLRMDDVDESDVDQRVGAYRRLSLDDCHRRFVMSLQRAVPESLRAPLVLFRLAPPAARIVVAMAFGDTQRANQLRTEQQEILPAIRDCHECQGRIFGNDDHCRCCGNPIWTFTWLRDS